MRIWAGHSFYIWMSYSQVHCFHRHTANFLGHQNSKFGTFKILDISNNLRRDVSLCIGKYSGSHDRSSAYSIHKDFFSIFSVLKY